MTLIARCILALFFLGTVYIPSAPLSGAKQLRWKLTQGDKFAVEMTQQMKQIVTVGDQTVEIPNTMVLSMTWAVDDIELGGAINMTQVIQRIQMTMRTATGEVKYDSSSQENPTGPAELIAGMMTPMVGAKFTQRMNDRGQILDLNVPKEALAGLEANPVMKQFFSDESFKKMMRQASPVLPDNPIEKGFSWQNQSESPTPVGTMKIDTTYTYEGEKQQKDKPLDHFSIQLKLDYVEPADPAAPRIKVVEQENSGAFFFDHELGYMARSEMSQKVTMEVTVGQNSVNQRIETTVDMTVKRSDN